ncbi:hypothetical protein Acy02nite_65490 [Actinoplanes cyaneus]|uniref:Uncharacterized protein n=1 Tax=Actinoplanes cyaneus TaxID=52696 RepID=A0A919ISB0_9ACTN|nr:hypothetical protein Acy02nite_65490 [Actinoplanes cyaneus]
MSAALSAERFTMMATPPAAASSNRLTSTAIQFRTRIASLLPAGNRQRIAPLNEPGAQNHPETGTRTDASTRDDGAVPTRRPRR